MTGNTGLLQTIPSRLLKQTAPVKIHDTEKDQWHEAFAVNIEAARIELVLKNCARALYYHETKRKFNGEAQALSAFLLSPTNMKINESLAEAFKNAETLLAHYPSKGENPKIFSYKFLSHENSAIVHMEFYENSKSIVRLNGY